MTLTLTLIVTPIVVLLPVSTLNRLNPKPQVLDGILIETTGLADPGPVCKTFYVEPDLRERTRVDCVLTVVDACHFLQQLSRSRSEGAVNESMQQVAFADKILLNKVDAASATSLQEVETTIRSINALCPILRCSLAKNPSELPLDELFTAQGFSLDRILETGLLLRNSVFQSTLWGCIVSTLSGFPYFK